VSAAAFVRSLAATAIIGGFAIQTPVHAIPIGVFSWDEHPAAECEAGLCGPLFSVGNFSTLGDPFGLGALGGSFFDVFVDLQGGVDSRSLLLGDVVDPDSLQSTEDVSGLVILSAGLRLTFAVPGLPGSVRLLDALDNVVAGLTGPGALLIDYRIDQTVTVPEPSTLLLLAGGLIGMAVGRRAQHSKTPQTSRMKRSSRRVFAT
jgi:hypothetical protein